jgi:hypothetical protein
MLKSTFKPGLFLGRQLNRQASGMYCGELLFDGGPPIYQRKQCNGGNPMRRIRRIWQLFKTASSKLVPVLNDIGIKVTIFFLDSPKSFELKCDMGFPFIAFVLPLGDMLTIYRPH